MKFSEIPYSRPDAEKTKAEIAELTERLKRAESYAEARAIFLEKEEKCKYTNTMALVAMIRRGMYKKRISSGGTLSRRSTNMRKRGRRQCWILPSAGTLPPSTAT